MEAQINRISCSFLSESLLYLAYMPFVTEGGLFIRTHASYSLGDEVQLSITLLQEPEEYCVHGKVVWITPKSAQNNKPSGIGVQFKGDNCRYLCNKIESYLAGMVQ